MSTKNKKIVYYLAAFLVVLMLVCTCLLGNTFARYVSSSSGTATTNVADWEVTASGSLHGVTTYELTTINNGISPNKDGNGSGFVSNSTTPVLLAKISIGSATDVDVALTISATTTTYTMVSGSSFAVSGTYDGEDSSSPTESEVTAALTITLYCTTGEANSLTISDIQSATGAAQLTSSNGVNTTWSANGTAVTYYVYGWVTWTTNYTTYETSGVNGGSTNSEGIYVADALDVWIAQHVDSLSTTITAQAVQNTQIN